VKLSGRSLDGNVKHHKHYSGLFYRTVKDVLNTGDGLGRIERQPLDFTGFHSVPDGELIGRIIGGRITHEFVGILFPREESNKITSLLVDGMGRVN